MSDPIVLWDKAAQRWFVSIVAFTSTFHQCFAISTTADATGSYNRYDFSFGTNLNDFPKFGVWPDAYYGSYNIFANGATFTGAEACAYDRTAMLAGGTAQVRLLPENGQRLRAAARRSRRQYPAANWRNQSLRRTRDHNVNQPIPIPRGFREHREFHLYRTHPPDRCCMDPALSQRHPRLCSRTFAG